MYFLVIFILSIALQCIDCVVFNIHACTADFCKNYKETVGCERLSTACAAQNRTHNGVIFRSVTPCSCCETCLANLNEGDDCSTGLLGAPAPNSICGNGLYCTIKHGNQHPTCEQMFATSECFRMKRKFDDDLKDGLIGHLQAKPSCDGDGNFSPVTCNSGQNCFCVNEKGERIFGDAPHRQNIEHVMHCGCSRLNDKLKDLVEQRFPFFTIRCKSDGSFDTLQCFGNLCLCIDSITGSPTSEIKNLTMTMNSDEATETLAGLRDLPCYDEKIHLDEFNFTRPCENIKRELINTILEAKRDGIDDAETHVDICDPDGSFKPVQYNDLSAFCVDHEGNKIEEFVALKNSTDFEKMHCKCARARNLLMKNNFLEIPECCNNGNYKSIACRRGFCYCVNEDGKQVSIEVIDLHKDKLPCFNDGEDLRDLPCYDEKIHLDEFNFSRPCESIKRELINTILEAKRDGIDDAETHVDICDPDGSFKPVQYNDLSAFCVDHEGNKIEEFVVLKNSTDFEKMHCKCARARNLLMKNKFLEIPECCINGNYKSIACRRGFCFCVNEDGKQVSIEVIDLHKDKLPCFNDGEDCK
ncbi:hypothetical protein PVAND_009413 [Polypedilum vanderplanki]|uniref:Thyroglobulin type-1 domain-containing protein n=1 Tax=Polypedilum vanderplanki TaxID=319348 RepID=A0A9J6CCN3_POLVA|nr:hypothetical protein PVAND_009413 [Polypedilum vanderplanki]